MHALDLRAWRAWLGLTQEAAAIELGCTDRHYRKMEMEEIPIPRAIEMSCVALQLGVRRYPSQVYTHLDDPVLPLDWLRGFAISATAKEIALLSKILAGAAVPADHPKAMRFIGRMLRLELVTVEGPEGARVFVPTPRGKQLHKFMVRPDFRKKDPVAEAVKRGWRPSRKAHPLDVTPE